MKSSRNLFLIITLVVLVAYFAGTVLADTSYDEGTEGDLSGNRFNPTVIMLTPGSNLLTATSVTGDLEYVTVIVPNGLQLKALILTSYTSTDDRSFVAVQSGSTFTEPPAGTNVSNLLGYTHFGTGLGQVGTDLLDDLASGAGAMGFTTPLSSGLYTFWLQETGIETSTYTLNFIVSPSTTTSSYDEGTDGDLADDRFNPTAVSLVEGGNILTATSVAGDLDYVTVSVPLDFQLRAILLESYVSTDDQAFVAIQSGSTFTEPATGTDVSQLLGYTHFGTAAGQVGTDILDDMGEGAGAIGFTPPLSSGPYTLWLQETGTATATYTLNFVITRADKKSYLPLIFR
ncbi:MAG: hypothetical protein HS126_12525 [Anaerolineales bacterium]|nr:hypothetical protein [Anaerolineales bacterium]